MENEFLFDDLEVEKDALPEGKSVDVFNALSLCDENLGKLYVDKGYNPYDENFVLTEEYAGEILQNKKDTSALLTENFLEQANKEISKNFNIALQNGQDLIGALANEEIVSSDTKVKQQIKKTIVTLKNRNEILKMCIDKLKQKDADALRMYKELYGLDGELGDLLKDSFTEKANMQALIMQFMSLIYKRSKIVYQKAKILKDKSLDANALEQEVQNAVAQSQAENQARQSALEQMKKEELLRQEEQEREQQLKQQAKEQDSKDTNQNEEEFTR